jgi:hypothetical protein
MWHRIVLVERYRFFGWTFCCQVQCRSGRFLRNMGTFLRGFTAWHPRKQLFSYSSNLTFYLYIHCAWKIMAGFQEAPSPNTQKASLWKLCPYIPPPKQFHHAVPLRPPPPHLPISIVWSFNVCGHQIDGYRRAPIWRLLIFLFLGYVNNYVHMSKIQSLNHLKAVIRQAAE